MKRLFAGLIILLIGGAVAVFSVPGTLVPPQEPLVDGYEGVVRVRIEPALPGACYEPRCYQGVLQDRARP